MLTSEVLFQSVPEGSKKGIEEWGEEKNRRLSQL